MRQVHNEFENRAYNRFIHAFLSINQVDRLKSGFND